MSELPDDAKSMLGNLRADYTRKTQELAAMRKQLENERSALLNSEFTQNIATMAAKEVTLDPYDDGSVEARIEKEVAMRLQEMMKPLQQEMKLKERKSQLTTFKSDHPDLMEPSIKQEVAKMLMERQELSLEDAYYIVKAKMSQSQLLELKRAEKEKKDTARSTLNLTKTGAQVNAQGIPQFRNAWEAFQWHKQNS